MDLQNFRRHTYTTRLSKRELLLSTQTQGRFQNVRLQGLFHTLITNFHKYFIDYIDSLWSVYALSTSCPLTAKKIIIARADRSWESSDRRAHSSSDYIRKIGTPTGVYTTGTIHCIRRYIRYLFKLVYAHNLKNEIKNSSIAVWSFQCECAKKRISRNCELTVSPSASTAKARALLSSFGSHTCA